MQLTEEQKELFKEKLKSLYQLWYFSLFVLDNNKKLCSFQTRLIVNPSFAGLDYASCLLAFWLLLFLDLLPVFD